MAAISFQHVTKEFENSRSPARSDSAPGSAAVDDVTLDVEDGEFVVLLGPSGCGKTTLLRMVNRLIEPTSGQIFLRGKEITSLAVTDLRRQIGYVIQQVGLFPHMTVAQNVAVVPKLVGWDRTRTRERTDALLNLVDLPPDEYRRRYPRQLSGGQQQRVGIARAMAADPAIMLMDEPFGAIDAITRGDLQNELLRIQRQVSKTILFVTHDVEEALRLADRIVVMRAGKVVQYDTPFNLSAHPADDFVRTLLGTQDILRQLSLLTVRAVMQPAPDSLDRGQVSIGADEDVRTALSLMLARGVEQLLVVAGDGSPQGLVTLDGVMLESGRLSSGSDPSAQARPDA